MTIKSIIEKIFQWILILSGLVMTVVFTTRGTNIEKNISIFIALLTYISAIKMKLFFKLDVFKNLKYTWLSLPIGFEILRNNMPNFITECETFGVIISKRIEVSIMLVAIIIMCVLINWFLMAIHRVISQVVKTQKIKPISIMMVVISVFIIVVLIYNQTSVFYHPTNENGRHVYDVIFTTDTSAQFTTNVFINLNAAENDIRQPLFGAFASPFDATARIISLALYFIPNIYPILLTTIQVLLLIFAVCMIFDLSNIKINKWIYLAIVFTSYPFIIFSITLEQYIFAVFYLILFIYLAIKKDEFYDVAFVGATGCMLTSGAVFTVIGNGTTLKERIQKIAYTGVKTVEILSIFGQIPVLLGAYSSISKLSRFAGGEVTAESKIMQFTEFVKTCFLSPTTLQITENNPRYTMAPVTEASILGIAIFIIICVCFYINRKNTFAKVAFYWVIMSVIILGIIGWGTVEQSLILYSLYFAWAYISLLIMGIDRIFNKTPTLKTLILLSLITYQAMINIPAFIELVEFGIKYYSA